MTGVCVSGLSAYHDPPHTTERNGLGGREEGGGGGEI